MRNVTLLLEFYRFYNAQKYLKGYAYSKTTFSPSGNMKKFLKNSFFFGEKFHNAEKGPLCSSNAFFQTENIYLSEGGTL